MNRIAADLMIQEVFRQLFDLGFPHTEFYQSADGCVLLVAYSERSTTKVTVKEQSLRQALELMVKRCSGIELRGRDSEVSG